MATNRDPEIPDRRPPRRARARAALRGEIAGVVRRTILEAAERVFERRGFDEAKMVEIAAEAGLATGTLYNYFDSKDNIVRALVSTLRTEFLGRLEPIADVPGPIEDVLTRIAQAVFANMQRHGSIIDIVAQRGGPTPGALRCAEPEEVCRQFFGVFERCMRRGLERSELARPPGARLDERARDLTVFLVGGMIAHVHAWLAEGRRGELTARSTFVVDTFLNGARGPSTRKTP